MYPWLHVIRSDKTVQPPSTNRQPQLNIQLKIQLLFTYSMESEQTKEISSLLTCISPKTILKRKIIHRKIPKIKQNKNLPKFVLGTCWHAQRNQILKNCSEETRDIVEESLERVKEWANQKTDSSRRGRDNLTLDHLKEIFGPTDDQQESRRRYYCAQAFFGFLRTGLFKIVSQSRKIQKTLTYFFFLEKFISRLGNPELLHHLQSK